MNPRTLPAAALCAALALTGCTGSDAPPAPTGAPSSSGGSASPEPTVAPDLAAARALPVLARLEGTEFGQGITLDLLTVERTSASHATARFLATVQEQDADGDAVTTSSLTRPEFARYRGRGLADVRLVDEPAGEVLQPLQADDGSCLCSEVEFSPEPGEAGQQALFVTFPAPAAGTTQVALQVGDFPMSPLVPLTQPGQPFTGEPTEPAAAAAEATRLDLISITTALDRSSRTTEQGDTVAVDVSADVLFAFGSDELSGRAEATLARVAEELQAEAVGPVEVVGHTDSVGDGAANQALSERRARAVQQALQPQLSRDGVTLTASGRGEQEPVARDRGRRDSEEAAANRRVTVTYTVAPPEPPAAPPAPSATPVDPKAEAVSSITEDGRQLEVLALERVSEGMVAGTFRLTNRATGPENLQQEFFERAVPNPYSGATLSGLRLVDAASDSAYAPLVDSTQTCLCTQLLARQLDPGESTLLHATFAAPPASSSTVDISVPRFDEPLADVPVTG